MKYQVFHTTTYHYSEPASLGHNETRLMPRDSQRQRTIAHRLYILPLPATTAEWTDYFGNRVTYFTLEEPHSELSVSASSKVEVFEPADPPRFSTPAWEDVAAALRAPQDPATFDALQFVFASPYTRGQEALGDYAAISFPRGRTLWDAALDLTGRIHREFRYDRGATGVNTPILDVFASRRGVCQDFAHLEIACFRAMGLAARYVSGYFLTDPPPGQSRLIGVDASHAWLAVFCPEIGWIDLDPTHNVVPSDRHITVAWGRDYGDVCPVNGIVLGGGSHAMNVAVDVSPVE